MSQTNRAAPGRAGAGGADGAAPGAPVLRCTPLHSVHAALGASFTDFGGWQMPLRYASDLAEHHAVRRSAGIFDLSHMGEVKVTGPGAAAALDHALVGWISKVALGRARYTMIVAEDGGIIDDLIVYHVGDQEYLVVPNAGNRERVAAELAARCAGFDCEVADISLTMALIAVQGPRAEEILRGVIGSGAGMPAALRPEEGAPDDDGDCGPDVLCGPTILRRLRYYAAVRAAAAGHSILLARTGYTGEDGFELFCGAEDAVDLWTVITGRAAALAPHADQADESGKPIPVLTPCGLAARDSLRLEAGMPLYGHELTEETTPYDASLGAVVALDKPEFIGRQALVARAAREDDHLGLGRLGGTGADRDGGLGAELAGHAHAPVGHGLLALGHRVSGPGRHLLECARVPDLDHEDERSGGLALGRVVAIGLVGGDGHLQAVADPVPGQAAAPPRDDAGQGELSRNTPGVGGVEGLVRVPLPARVGDGDEVLGGDRLALPLGQGLHGELGGRVASAPGERRLGACVTGDPGEYL